MRTPHLFPLLLVVGLGAPAAANAAVLPAASVDGPSADIKTLGNVDIASDGTGGVVWIKAEGGKEGEGKVGCHEVASEAMRKSGFSRDSGNYMAGNANNLVWLDMEMTGLNPDGDRIIEMAMVTANCW